jgi:hypothetical protein
MLVNPESTTRRRRRRKQKPLQIIFTKPVRRLRANPEYVDRARNRSKALVGNLIGKHVAGSLGAAAAWPSWISPGPAAVLDILAGRLDHFKPGLAVRLKASP